MVNVSRTFGVNVLSFLKGKEVDTDITILVKRHLAFTYALKNQLREKQPLKDSISFLLPEELAIHEVKSK